MSIRNQEFYEEATAVVWRNINQMKFIPTGHFGHAAVMLRGPTVGCNRDEYRYISWWPGEGADKKDALREQEGDTSDDIAIDMMSELSPRAREGLRTGQFQPREGQVDLGGGDYGAWPDAEVSIQGISFSDGVIGLNLRAMWNWYAGYVNDGGTYQLASRKKSCSGVAAAALVEGGGDAFATPPSALIYLEPKQVETYARKLRSTLDDLNRRFISFDLSIAGEVQRMLQQRGTIGVTGTARADDLWDYDTWKKQSEVKGAFRSSVIQKIDSALRDYHQYSWNVDFRKKYKAFITILDNVMKHREAKPDSSRGFAVARLGKQCCDVFHSRQIVQ